MIFPTLFLLSFCYGYDAAEDYYQQLLVQAHVAPGGPDPCLTKQPVPSAVCFDVFGWVDLTTVQATSLDWQVLNVSCQLPSQTNLSFPWDVPATSGLNHFCQQYHWAGYDADVTKILQEVQNEIHLSDEEIQSAFLYQAFYLPINVTAPNGTVVEAVQKGIPLFLGEYGTGRLPFNYYVPLRLISSYLRAVNTLPWSSMFYSREGNPAPNDVNVLPKQSLARSVQPPRIAGAKQLPFVAFSGVDGTSGGRFHPKLPYCHSAMNSTVAFSMQSNDYYSFATRISESMRYTGVKGSLMVWYSSKYGSTGIFSSEYEVIPSVGIDMTQIGCDTFADDAPLVFTPELATLRSVTAISYMYEASDPFTAAQERQLKKDMQEVFCHNWLATGGEQGETFLAYCVDILSSQI